MSQEMTEDFETKQMMRKVTRLNEHLSRRFDVSLDFTSVDYLRLVQQHYQSNRDFIVQRYGMAESLQREDYAKAVMITEAIAMFLREISPARTKPRNRPRKDPK